MLQICIAAWSVFPWVVRGTLGAVTTVVPPRRIVLLLLLFGWCLTVLPWCTMGDWSWLRRCILNILVSSSWLASWGLSLTGLISWSLLRVSVPAFDDILGVPIGSFLLPGVLDLTQWCVWDSEVSPASCQKIWWCSPYWFSPSCCWVRLWLPHPHCLEEWRAVRAIRRVDTILDGGGPSWWWPWISGTARPLCLIGSGRY